MDKSKLGSKTTNSKYCSSEREVLLLNAIEQSNGEQASIYKEALGGMITPHETPEKKQQIGGLRYKFATNEMNMETWAVTLEKLSSSNSDVKSYLDKYKEYKKEPTENNLARLGEADVKLMRKEPEAYEVALAVTSYAIADKKDDFSFVNHNNLWKSTFYAQNERLKELFSRGEQNLIKEVLDNNKEKAEKIERPATNKSQTKQDDYFPLEYSYSAMETGLITKIAIYADEKNLERLPNSVKEKQAFSLMEMSNDYLVSIGDNEISMQGLGVGKNMVPKPSKPKNTLSMRV